MLIGRKVVVLGAGVAGLAVARALAMRGAAVTVLEQAEAIREVGAGLQISPNGARVLRALGYGEALEASGPRTQAVVLRDGVTGTSVARLPMARLRPQSEYRVLHRARLIEMLADGARAAGVEIRLLQKVQQVNLGAHRPQITTAFGTQIEADLLIGADGLHSHTRSALNGDVAPFFTHQVAWRALIPCEADAPPVSEVFMGPGRHLVSYPLGQGLRNIVAVEERARWVEESWNLRDDSLTLHAAFDGFCPRVRGWLDQVDAPYLWGLFRHPVAARWHGNGAVLLGDAAHPTLPFLAQGANLALEDAWLLAEALAQIPDEGEALAAYQALRAPRCSAVVEAANRNAHNFHLTGVTRTVAHMGLRMLSRVAPEKLVGRFDWIYGYDATSQGYASSSIQTGT